MGGAEEEAPEECRVPAGLQGAGLQGRTHNSRSSGRMLWSLGIGGSMCFQSEFRGSISLILYVSIGKTL